MKQHITVDQYQDLSDNAKDKLSKWWQPKIDIAAGINLSPDRSFANVRLLDEDTNYPLLSIGQMIEFLANEQDRGNQEISNLMLSKGKFNWHLGTMGNPFEHVNGIYKDCPELSDVLWEAVKEVLEK